MGLKLRDERSPLIELKVRVARGEKGDEEWNKVISSHMKSQQVWSAPFVIEPSVLNEIENILTSHISVHSDVQKSIDRLKSGEYKVVRLEKLRNQSWGFHYVTESTWIKWSFMDERSSQIPEGYSFSACCEGNNDLAKKAKKFRKQYPDCSPQGYPEFCCKLLSQT
jgi:hypothetical protein